MCKGSFSINYWERGSHARSVYPTQDTSRMGTATAKQEEEADTRRYVGSKEKTPTQDPTSANNLTIELPEGRESFYHILD